MSRELRSDVDWREAMRCGEAAVHAALAGESGVMVALEREPGPEYACRTTLVPLEEVAGLDRQFPTDWIDVSGYDVSVGFRQWAEPLVGPLAADESIRPGPV